MRVWIDNLEPYADYMSDKDFHRAVKAIRSGCCVVIDWSLYLRTKGTVDGKRTDIRNALRALHS